ncbi:malto-oligosyltrehalose trehalohydrolase [Nitratireductor aestuarii]|uniref:Malto-oligosyltrehalose trehalohydrolase n=1 Tax=Nitratireductor aestuarii TaxID=1735103 RepID=A0A916RXV2_9HYPH|nr:malto-oligosyltrehalose trehalohydrolase [Nitratireductor aestuarii]GGA72126.1 malto-oligosyltrehalose trehalohydrolase [Nitratireductor aestuarii]
MPSIGPQHWGARLLDDGEAHFRLWAPALHTLAVEIDGNAVAMNPEADGWFGVTAPAAPGARYQFLLPDGTRVPDPASQAQAGDVHGPSLLVDQEAYEWRSSDWLGRPWEEAVVYELHVGTFTPEGTFAAASQRVEHLASLGITAIEIMPVAQFGGTRGWGYDGVLPYAPHNAYGSPDDMKAFIDTCHEHGVMVLLDVVYNHFGPDGNYLSSYAPDFFDPSRNTPWGAAIAYEREPVRQFFIDNALYWLRDIRLDGLRFDAIDQIKDDKSDEEILLTIARRIRETFPERHIHLTTEDNRNVTHLHERGPNGKVMLHTAEWNDDFHNVCHVIATGETDGYYQDFADDIWTKLARSLAEGFIYQGEPSPHQESEPRGKPSAHLPPASFVNFLQNHDQTGNRALGERLTTLTDPHALEMLQAILLLSPAIPLVFMGEEYGETRPFLFFTDFTGDLAVAVREGRRREFADFTSYQGETVPDPNALNTFNQSKLDWEKLDTPEGKAQLARFRNLLDLRQKHIVPLLKNAGGNYGRVVAVEEGALAIDWQLGEKLLQLRCNFTEQELTLPEPRGVCLYSYPGAADAAASSPHLRPQSLTFWLE